MFARPVEVGSTGRASTSNFLVSPLSVLPVDCTSAGPQQEDDKRKG